MTIGESLTEIAKLSQDELAVKLLRIAEDLPAEARLTVRVSAALLHAKDELIAAKTAKVFTLTEALAERDRRIAELDAALQAWVAAYPEAAE
jgi:hypothetical protein